MQDFNLLLTFDEFEKAGEALEFGQLSRNVLNQLRTLIEHQQKMALLFAGVQTLDELGPDYSSYFINARSLSMGYLQRCRSRGADPQPRPAGAFRAELRRRRGRAYPGRIRWATPTWCNWSAPAWWNAPTATSTLPCR